MTVPVARHLCHATMRELGVEPSCIGDVLVALSEACTNVIDHSIEGHDYEVHLTIEEERVTIDVRDEGRGFDVDANRRPAGLAEAGRGIDLMHGLVDRVSFTVEPQDGTIVHLYKQLEFVDGHPVRDRLLGARDDERG